MYCIRCGKKLEDGVKYCTRCGAPIQNYTSARADAPAGQGQQEDDFTIRIPPDYIQAEAAQHIQQVMEQAAAPEEPGDDGFTRAMAREEIVEAMKEDAPETQPEEPGDDGFTRAMVREEIIEAGKDDTATAQPDEEGDADYTRMVPKEEIQAALKQQEETDEEQTPPVDVGNIPDIPIPSDYIAQEAPRYYTPPKPYVPAEHTVHRLAQEEDEPLMSGRSLLIVVLVVILFFAIAVGAFVFALNNTGNTDAGSGSGSAEVGFWSGDPSE